MSVGIICCTGRHYPNPYLFNSISQIVELEDFLSYCKKKAGVTADYPFKGEAVWMKVMGKMFAMTNVKELQMEGEMVAPFHFINLKCDPERAVKLRSEYDSIGPGWHQSKVHWNSLYMDGSLPDQLIFELIDHSYELVASSLTAKLKKELNELI